MTYAELKELVETMDENYNAEYLANKEVVIEYRDKDGHYQSPSRRQSRRYSRPYRIPGISRLRSRQLRSHSHKRRSLRFRLDQCLYRSPSTSEPTGND